MSFTKTNDNQLVKNIKENNNLANDSVNLLLDRHLPLYNKIVSSIVTGVNHENIMDDKYYVLFEAARKFDENKNVKFSSWFGNCARYHTLNYLSSIKQQNDIAPFDENNNNYQYTVNHFDGENEKLIYDKLKSLPDKRIFRIFDLRFKKDLHWRKIAKKMRLSTTSCIELYNKGKKILKKELASKDISVYDTDNG